MILPPRGKLKLLGDATVTIWGVARREVLEAERLIAAVPYRSIDEARLTDTILKTPVERLIPLVCFKSAVGNQRRGKPSARLGLCAKMPLL